MFLTIQFNFARYNQPSPWAVPARLALDPTFVRESL